MKTEDLDKFIATKPPKVAGLGYVVAFLVGLLGALVGGYCGYVFKTGLLLYEYTQGAGVFPIITAMGGFVIFFSIGVCVFGPGEHLYGKFVGAAPSKLGRLQVTGLSSFDLYVTVHRIRNLFSTDCCAGGVACPYVEVLVGRYVDEDRPFLTQRNLPKRTCVARANSFEECFHFVVSPTDDTIRFIVYDQDVLKNKLVGRCDVNIDDDVLAEGFPQKKSFMLARGDALDDEKSAERDADRHGGSIVVSFAPGADFPDAAAAAVRRRNPFATERLRTVTGRLRDQAEHSAGQYGALVTGGLRGGAAVGSRV